MTKIPEGYLRFEDWPSADDSKFAADIKRRYTRLRDGVELYLAGHPMNDVSQAAGVSKRRFHKLIARCVRAHEDGRIWGLRALKYGSRIETGPRSSPFVAHPDGRSGYRGMFIKFIHEHPEIAASLTKELRGQGLRPAQVQELSVSEAFKTFKIVCKSCGIGECDYPLNTVEKGRRAFRKWMHTAFLKRYASDWIGHKYGRSAAQAWDYAGGDGQARNLPDPYSVWQIDQVTVDVEAKFLLPNDHGDWEDLDISRPLVLRAIDVGTGAKIANRLVLARQASAEDMSILLWDAVAGPPESTTAISSLKKGIVEGGGYPASVIPELKFAVPRIIYLDNALAHLSDHVNHLISHTWGGIVKLGNVMTPQERATIESEYSAQAKKLLRKLPGATGSHPRDPLRKTASVELADRIDTNALEQTIDSYTANENALPAARSGNIPPLVRLKRQLESGALKPLYLSAAKRKAHYFGKSKRVIVHVDLKSGRRPYINFLYRRYSSRHLQTQIGLKGKSMWARADFRNLQSILLFNEDGTEFGPVDVLGPWGRFPHDVRIQKLFGRLKRKGALGEHAEDRPLEALFAYLRQRSPQDRGSALNLAYLVTYLERNSSLLFPAIRAELQDWISAANEADVFLTIPVNAQDLSAGSRQVARGGEVDTEALETNSRDADNVETFDASLQETRSRNPKLPRRVSLR